MGCPTCDKRPTDFLGNDFINATIDDEKEVIRLLISQEVGFDDMERLAFHAKRLGLWVDKVNNWRLRNEVIHNGKAILETLAPRG